MIRKTRSDVEATVQLGGDITKKAKKCKLVLKAVYEEPKEMYGEENIISAVIHVDETTPPSVQDLKATKRGIYRRKT